MGDAAEPRELRRTFIVPAIKPFDHYDFARAKIACNLAWLVAKAFGTENVPEELREPFYTDQYDQEHIKPPVVHLLLSAELYCRAGSLILKSDAAKPLVGHDAVVQALAQKGLYVTDQERLVTERDLQRKPIQMSAHLAMIDTLMMAYTAEMVSVEKVIACAQRYSTFFQATDLPYDIEDAVMYWINKVNEHLKDILEQEQKLKEHHTVEAPGGQKSNYLVFMAELFWWFEVVKPSFVQPRVLRAQGAEPAVRAPDTRASTVDSSQGPASAEGDAFPHRHHLPSRHSRPQPPSSASGGIRRSSSMSYVDGFIGTWPKEKRSSVHGVSFDISFDKENTVPRGAPNRGLPRSASNEGLSLNRRVSETTRKSLSFKPVNGEGEAGSIEEELSTDPGGGFPAYVPHPPHKLSSSENTRSQLPNGALPPGLLLDELGNQVEAPSIEEALQIIHDTERRPLAPPPGHVANGFFLHSQDLSPLNANLQLRPPSPDRLTDTKGALSPVTDDTEVDTGIHVPSEDLPGTVDEDSSLRDYTVSLDSDMDDAPKLLQDYDLRPGSAREAPSPCPSTVSTRSQPGSSASSSSGVKMTSFAEQKFRKLNHTDGRSSGSSSQKTTPEGSELNIPHVVAWAQSPEDAGPPGRDSTQLLASEVLQLHMRLEEKRRAIEAQKKKVEAAFTRQRQKMGRTAFLTVVKKRGDGGAPLREEAAGAEDEKVFSERAPERELPRASGQRSKSLADIKEGLEGAPAPWPTSPTDPERPWGAASPPEEPAPEGEVLEYTRSIEKLNASLHFLQQEMQRLSQQQEALMRMRDRQSWVISPPQPAPHRPARDPRPARPGPSPEPPRPTHPSPQPIHRKSASFSIKTPRTPRPNELKIAPLNRTLTPPRSVDSLPRLRRFSPSQVPIQTRSFVCFGDDGEPRPGKDGADAPEASEPPARPPGEAGKPVESSVSEVLAQPVTETVCLTPSADPPGWPAEPAPRPAFPPSAPKNVSLIEVSLSDLKPPEKADVSLEKEDGESDREQLDDEQKVCCGFFFKDDQKAEDDMALKRAALLEKRLRREKETQLRKQQLEAEMEHKKEETRRKTEEERQKKEDERARREFIRQEYLRRKQLKLMEDMDTVIKPRPPTAKQKKQRPKSMHRDHMEPPKTPTQGPPASLCLSVSSLSLASLTTGDSESVQSGKRTPRTKALQGAQRQVQQAHHPERAGALLPGGQGERGPEEADPRGDGEVGRQQLPDPVPGLGLPVPVSVHLLPGDGGHRQADRDRPQVHQQEDDRGPLQVQLRQEAVQPHSREDAVGQRGRHHHPQPPVAEQAARDTQEAAAHEGVGSGFAPGPSWGPPPPPCRGASLIASPRVFAALGAAAASGWRSTGRGRVLLAGGAHGDGRRSGGGRGRTGAGQGHGARLTLSD
ncbi:calmodulin-regulated spectrin-associated protein 2 isoform X5 [Myotis daubentonii]|uniref:calmodulin-regulated spectrin-associated protein 2 isoform X5 n=1 Tax=Myotis daubentonii TaxID=98922 RepID=UPI0028730F2F|nr:calmodulin-regulated spectrin-associated protein 2 isoform X5 [Myotis daubentonii]